MANGTQFGLDASVWGSDKKQLAAVAARLEAGTVFVNKHAEIAPNVPFGGIKCCCNQCSRIVADAGDSMTQINRLISLVFVFAAAQSTAAAAAADAAGASAETAGLEEILVTAQRREERLQDVPISVSVYNQAIMDAQGTRHIDDIARLTPGLTFFRGTINNNSESSDIAIRGIDSTAGAATTGVYIDDVPIQGRHLSFGTFNAYPQLFDIDRVEVLRGPQGTLFGSGSEGGTVRFITPEPGLHQYSGIRTIRTRGHRRRRPRGGNRTGGRRSDRRGHARISRQRLLPA